MFRLFIHSFICHVDQYTADDVSEK